MPEEPVRIEVRRKEEEVKTPPTWGAVEDPFLMDDSFTIKYSIQNPSIEEYEDAYIYEYEGVLILDGALAEHGTIMDYSNPTGSVSVSKEKLNNLGYDATLKLVEHNRKERYTRYIDDVMINIPKIDVVEPELVCNVTFSTLGYEIYWGEVMSEKGEYKGKTPLSFYVEGERVGNSVEILKYISVEKDGEIVKKCLGIPFDLHKGVKAGDCWSVKKISSPCGEFLIPHKGTETGMTFDIDDKRVCGSIVFFGEGDKIDVYIDGMYKGTIFNMGLRVYLPPGTYRVEQAAAGVRCYADAYYANGEWHVDTDGILVEAEKPTIVDVDMYSSPLEPPPQFALDAAIRHMQEIGWEGLPSEWSCYYACRKCVFTKEWCYINAVPEVCGYEKAVHYWLVSHPGFLFPKTEICEVTIQARGQVKIANQPGLDTTTNYLPYIFNCSCLVGEQECTKYASFIISNGETEHRCEDAKIVFRKNELEKWIIDREKSSSCIDIFEYTGTSTGITLTIKAPLAGHVNITKSTIPSVIYLKILVTFSMQVENTGEEVSAYKVALIFTGIDVPKEYEFTSEWSETVKSGETTKLNVEVALPLDAIPADKDEVIYEIKTILEAKI